MKTSSSHSDRLSARLRGLLDEREIEEIERAWPNGLTSRQIVDVFETRGIRFSEATLRKYVQLGLLPRSVRVGRKGKHRGSCGLYPAHVIRRVNVVKGMMAADRTIEEIQRSFARFKDEIDTVEKDLRDLIAGFEREAKAPAVATPTAAASSSARSSRPSAPPASWSGGSAAWNDEFRHKPPSRPRAERRPPGATFIDPWPTPTDRGGAHG